MADETLKFLCSYSGKIVLTRQGHLRYAGGFTRVLAVDRAVSFAELMVKIGEFCGFSATLRCQLPGGDLETLISVTSEDDLADLIEEYARASPAGKIRAVLNPRKPTKTVSPPISVTQSVNPAPAATKPVGQFVAPVKPAHFVVPGMAAKRNPYNRCNVGGKSGGVLHQHLHQHYHHHQLRQGVPASYYWQ